MTRRFTEQRCPWEDRFRTPGLDELREGVGKTHQSLFDYGRELLLAQALEEALAWHGVPWRWSLVYRAAGTPTAYLIPQPGKPMISILLTAEQVAAVPPRKHTRTVRDGITYSARVGGTHWPTWEITSKPLADEVIGLLRVRQAPLPA
ncbi:MAG: DUF3788 family protein [Phycisphaerales bacterium]|nr:DUF3788 family protein [Phycisphaerales bacterium]